MSIVIKAAELTLGHNTRE